MNKKGFTLIELLAVIVLLGVIGGIAYASVLSITGNIQQNMLEKKANMIEEAAILYGGDRKGSIAGNSKKYNGYSCISIFVYELVPDYLDSDNDNDCLEEPSTEAGCIVNPINQGEYLDTKEVIIYYKNKRIRAKLNIDGSLVCS